MAPESDLSQSSRIIDTLFTSNDQPSTTFISNARMATAVQRLFGKPTPDLFEYLIQQILNFSRLDEKICPEDQVQFTYFD